jgi:hypothetical protein
MKAESSRTGEEACLASCQDQPWSMSQEGVGLPGVRAPDRDGMQIVLLAAAIINLLVTGEWGPRWCWLG